MSEAELILFIESSQALDSNFEFWLTASSALLVASYLVTERIHFSVFFVATFLYIASTILFMMRGATMGRTLTSILDQLRALNGETSLISANQNLAVAALYFVIMVTGSTATVLFVYGRYRRLHNSRDA